MWRKPTFGEVWRERSFEVVIDHDWITGVFDRVILERDTKGGISRLTIIDFKTDHGGASGKIDTLAAKYSPQLNLYCQVAGILTGVRPEQIACSFVFTRAQKMVAAKPLGSQE